MLDRPPAFALDSQEGRDWLEGTASARGIDAFVDVIGDNAPVAVDVWICERAPLRLRVSRVVPDPNSDDAAATLAIRAIEVLRSSFLALDFAAANAPRETPAVPVQLEHSRAPLEQSSPLGVELGAGALAGFDGVSPALLPLVRLGWTVRPWFALEATGAGFGTKPTLEAAAGSVSVAQAFGLLGLCLCSPANHGIHPLLSLSVGALHTALEARTSLPNVAHHATHWSALADAGVGARLGLTDRFYLTLAAHVQLAEPYVAIHVLDTVVATTGSPNVLVALSAGARL